MPIGKFFHPDKDIFFFNDNNFITLNLCPVKFSFQVLSPTADPALRKIH